MKGLPNRDELNYVRAQGRRRAVAFSRKGSALGKYRVVDLRTGVVEPEHVVDARSPEAAAIAALGEKGVRGGQNRARMFCRVYWTDNGGQTNMVRLYRPLEADAEPSSPTGVVPGA